MENDFQARDCEVNFTIVVNWKERGFGCAKNCSYCSWRSSPLLPNGSQSEEEITKFIRQCKKSFVTISGGGDPLYKFEENRPKLEAMAAVIRREGFKVRLITREVKHIPSLKGVIDCFSVSLDADVMREVIEMREILDEFDVEYSLVLPPLPTEEIVKLKPQYYKMRRVLARTLVLRENLNSVYPLDFKKLSFGNSAIVYVPKKLCLSSRYLSKIDCSGYDIVQDNEGLANFMMHDPNLILFGGFVKHIVDPKAHMEYGDIDVIATDAHSVAFLEHDFGYSFKKVSPDGAYPAYYIGRSDRAGKDIQLILMRHKLDAMNFIESAQYDVDRLAYCNGDFLLDTEEKLDAIKRKVATLQHDERDMSLFSRDRPLIEQKHKLKLMKKGFKINE